MRKIGLHIRLETTIFDVAEKAYRLHAPIFQCFFIKQKTDKFIDLSDEEFAHFKKEWACKFDYLYVHGTFWVNLAASRAPRSFSIMKHELHLAQKLGFTHYILHPGSALGSKTKRGGIDHLAKALNKLVDEAGDVIITLENTAHAGMSLGGDPEDFKILMEKIDKPEKIAFCIDTAHAYAYGYNIADEKAQDNYIALLDDMIGLKNVVILHVNDTKDALGSKVDRHVTPGEGKIGALALKRFINHKAFSKIPIIIELPPLPEEQEKEILHTIKTW